MTPRLLPQGLALTMTRIFTLNWQSEPPGDVVVEVEQKSVGESVITVKSINSRLLRLALALITACASISSVAQTQPLDLPDMGASADSILSRKEEEEYAKALVRQMRAYEVLVEDPLISDYFEDMGYRLASNSDRPDKSFTFVVLDQPVVNAFAAPGGVIALYTGLILAADDENEVAGVLAHEIAHITQLHLYRALENQQAMTIPIALAMLGLILAGYDPAGMGEFFEKMGRITRAMGEGPPEYLRTHPVSVTRIAEADNRAQNMPKPPPSDGKNFYLMQARLRALSEKSPDTALKWFDHRMDRADVSQAETDALFYGRAIALQRKGEFGEARKLLQSLLDRDRHLAYELQLADLNLESGNAEAAIGKLAALYQDFPGNHSISLQYAEALLHDAQPAQAETAAVVLRQQLLTRSRDPRLYELYGHASNLAGDAVRAKEAIAESYYLRGGIHEAAMQLQELIARDDLDYYQRARITARVNELRLELAKLGLEEP